MQILIIILVFVIVFLIWFFNNKVVHTNIGIELLDVFLYSLKYRGNTDESLKTNGALNLTSISPRKTIGIVKYNEKGNIGFYLLINFSALNGIRNNFDNYFKKKKLEYFIWENLDEKAYAIDLRLDFKSIKNTINFIYSKLFKYKNSRFDLNYSGNICKKPGKLIDFKDAKELEEKGINIDIPVTKGQWLIYKLKGKKTCP